MTYPSQDQIDALVNLYYSGQMKKTEQACIELLRIYPQSFTVLNILGVVLHGQGKLREAVKSFDKAIQLKPDFADAHSNRGNALNDLGQAEEAVQSYEQAIRLKPDFAVAYNNLCDFYEKHNMVAELANILHQAQKALPKNDPHLLFRMAQLASREKRLEDARGYLELINPEAFPLQVRACYTELLAKTYNKLGQFNRAFTQFEITNQIVKQTAEAKQFNDQRYLNSVSELAKSWSSAAKVKWPVMPSVPNRHSLAFIVGFPRSGTTLLDTILRSHSEVTVVEEQPMVRTMRELIGGLATPELLTALSNGQLSELRKAYYDELYSHIELGGSYRLIIDKFPLNIIQAALIHRVFPDAKFILALRHPYDCVLSCFMHNFRLNDAMVNFLSLEQAARLYDAVMSLWSSYNNVLDLDVGVVKYEELVLDLQGTVEPLLNFLNLDWHDDLLDYQQTAISRGNIGTPSYNQVTQKLYTQASGRWKNYRDQIKGTLPLLEPWAERFGYPVAST